MRRRIKVLQFLSTASLAGTELSVLSLASKMDREKFETEVCFLYPEGPVSHRFLKANIKCYHLDYGRINIFGTIFRLYKILKGGRYDIIHIYGLKANIIGRFMGRLAGCKNIVAGLRSITPSNTESNLSLFLDKITLCLIKLYISNSKKGVNFLIEKGYPAKIFQVVHSGIDANTPIKKEKDACLTIIAVDRKVVHSEIDIDAQIKKEKDACLTIIAVDRKVVHSGIDANTPIKKEKSKVLTITTVARFEPPKDYKTLLLAFDILSKRGFEFTSLLVGGGSKKEEMMELSAMLGLKEKVSFLGEKENVSDLLLLSDIFVFSSLFEGLPRAIMEAMVAHLPVVATNVGGVPELVDDGKTGFLVPVSDASAMASKIERLLLDSSLRAMMGEAGLKKIRAEFSMDRIVKEMEEIYTQLAGRN